MIETWIRVSMSDDLAMVGIPHSLTTNVKLI
jgi:hypothetical protein